MSLTLSPGGGGGGGIYVVSTDKDVPADIVFFSDLVRVWVGNSCPGYLHDPYFFIKWYPCLTSYKMTTHTRFLPRVFNLI